MPSLRSASRTTRLSLARITRDFALAVPASQAHMWTRARGTRIARPVPNFASGQAPVRDPPASLRSPGASARHRGAVSSGFAGGWSCAPVVCAWLRGVGCRPAPVRRWCVSYFPRFALRAPTVPYYTKNGISTPTLPLPLRGPTAVCHGSREARLSPFPARPTYAYVGWSLLFVAPSRHTLKSSRPSMASHRRGGSAKPRCVRHPVYLARPSPSLTLPQQAALGRSGLASSGKARFAGFALIGARHLKRIGRGRLRALRGPTSPGPFSPLRNRPIRPPPPCYACPSMGTGGTAPYGLENRLEPYPRAAIHGRPQSKAREAGFSV